MHSGACAESRDPTPLYSLLEIPTGVVDGERRLIQLMETAGNASDSVSKALHSLRGCEGAVEEKGESKEDKPKRGGGVKRSRAGRVLRPVPAWWLGRCSTRAEREGWCEASGVGSVAGVGKSQRKKKKRSVLEIGGHMSETEGSADKRRRAQVAKAAEPGGGGSEGERSWNWPVRGFDGEALSPVPWHLPEVLSEVAK